LGNDGNPGTPDAPVASLSRAILLAEVGEPRVYACAEYFHDEVTLPAGVSLYGGFFCEPGHWRHVGQPMLTTLHALTAATPLTLTGSAGDGQSVITDLDVQAVDATTAGGSSIAVLALADANADLRRCVLEAGKGWDGLDGEKGDHFGEPAKKGRLGNSGQDACTGLPAMGGAMVALLCDDDGSSMGGAGGDGGDQAANPGADGVVAPAPNPKDFGLGGQAEDVLRGLACTPGLDGAKGKSGSHGLGGAGPGRLTEKGYVGVWGGQGEHGWPGQGGGGGGASVGSKAACGIGLPHGGASGGSGGTGGCGGRGGKGGQPGGASIALATLSARVTGQKVKLVAARGGNGGRGSPAQKGAQGGLPGVGGAGWGGASPGCHGGKGGFGGDGGHGGGGLGGPSVGLAYVGVTKPSIVELHAYVASGGDGGLGGDPLLAETNGQAGASAEELELDP
jgi:hypothetical protein